jgi:uncharacterized protein involved in response to NO
MKSRSLLVSNNELATAPTVSVLAKGFRPFFLAAAVHAVFSVPLWIAALSGTPWLVPRGNPLEWHAHEMVFGFTGAVIAGFLLTAVANWTGRATLEGGALAALLAVWLGGRIAPWLPGVSGWVAAGFDIAFWAGLALACGRPIVASRNERNFGFIALLLGFLLAATLSHVNRLGLYPPGLGAGRLLGVDLVVLPILVITSRVVPMFTRNATSAAGIASRPALDRAAIVSMALLTLLDLLSAPTLVRAALSIAVGVFTFLRARDWGAELTLGKPLLWTLHLGGAWVGAGSILRGLSPLVPGLSPSIALHAITAGGIGLLCLGMMTRVTLGHTGRMLAIPSSMAWAMRALSLAVVLRVVGPVLLPSNTLVALFLAALFWSLAFGCYLAVYAKALLSPRVDGRPG